MTATVTTIAYCVLATRQILDDVAMLQSYIDGRLRYGLAYAEELQLINGDGTGTNLNGVYTQATTFASPLAAANADLDDRKSVVSGKSVYVSVDLGGRRILKQTIKLLHSQYSPKYYYEEHNIKHQS